MSGSEPAGPAAPLSGGLAHVDLSSPIPSLELSLNAWDFRPVASGLGRLTADVPPGIYQLVARAGPAVERRLIQLVAGATYHDDRVSVRFPSAAPVIGTSTSHEYHEALAAEASGGPPRFTMPGSAAGLVVMLRDVRGQNGPPMEASELAQIQILDGNLAPLVSQEQGWLLHSPDAAAAWSGSLPAGPYALQLVAGETPAGARRASPGASTLQSVWLQAGWQTLIFITTGDDGPDLSSASVHLLPLGVGWGPYQPDLDQALELAQWGLREGRAVVPDDLMGRLLRAKFQDPWLGIVAAHGLLLRQALDAPLLTTVLTNLQGLVPGHPDVAGLRCMAAERGVIVAAPPVRGVTWPPMLLASYRGLIRADARDPGVIADGSPAQQLAAFLSYQGIWTCWNPAGAEPRRGSVAGPAVALKPAAVLAELGRGKTDLRAIEVSDPGAVRVRRYLTSVADLESPDTVSERFLTMSPQEIGLATSLPASSVDHALRVIGAALPPVPTPNAGSGGSTSQRGTTGGGSSGGGTAATGGGGLLGGHAALAAAIVLSGVVLTGAVALALRPPSATPGHTEVPQATPSVTATPSPTEPPTPLRTPAPIIQLRPSSLDFGDVAFGSRSDPAPIRLTNGGGSPLTVLDLRSTGAPQHAFVIDPGNCAGDVLMPREWCVATVIFAPPDVGPFAGSLQIDTKERPPKIVPLSGTGSQPAYATLSYETYHFFDWSQSTPYLLTIVATGTGAQPVSIDRIDPIGLNGKPIEQGTPDMFSIDWSSCAGVVLAPDDAGCQLSISVIGKEGSDVETWDYAIVTSDGTAYPLTLAASERIG